MEKLNLFLQIFNLIIQALILLIPFFGTKSLFDMRRGVFEIPTKRGYLLVALIVIVIISASLQIIISNRINENNDNEFKKVTAKRDSINQFNTMELLAKYGLKVDSRSEEIVKVLRDSSLNKTTIINGNAPHLWINNIEMTGNGDTCSYKIWYCSKEAVSYNVDVLLDIIAYNMKSDSFSYVLQNIRDISIVHLPKDECLISDGHGFIGHNKTNDIYIFRLHGTIEKYGNRKIKIDYLYSYYFASKQFGALFPETHISLLKYLEKEKNKSSKLNSKHRKSK